MNSCGVQRVVLGIFSGVIADCLIFELLLLLGFGAALLAGALMTLTAFAGTDLAFDFTATDFTDLLVTDLV